MKYHHDHVFQPTKLHASGCYGHRNSNAPFLSLNSRFRTNDVSCGCKIKFSFHTKLAPSRVVFVVVVYLSHGKCVFLCVCVCIQSVHTCVAFTQYEGMWYTSMVLLLAIFSTLHVIAWYGTFDEIAHRNLQHPTSYRSFGTTFWVAIGFPPPGGKF